jgi:hypothetical protein
LFLWKNSAVRLLKRILFVGFPLLFFLGFLIVTFPNAEWNRAASRIAFGLSIGLVFIALGFSVMVALRLASRILKRLARSSVSDVPRTAHSGSHGPGRLVLGLIAAIAVAGFVTVLLAFIEREIKSSPVFQTSVAMAQASPAVFETLGHPLTVGWFVSGQLTEVTNGSGHATLSIPIKGPKGTGKLRVEAGRRNGNWQISTLRFVNAGHDSTIDLLSEKVR